jgi:septal ring factor EnvC (AmiA/AmiB activator)
LDNPVKHSLSFIYYVSQFKTEISDLKANLCEKQAKIRSLESELASFRGNYKANLEETRGKLETYEIKLIGQAENVIKLEQKTDKICKDLERIKKQQSKRIEVIDAERSEGSLDILVFERS